MLVVETLGFWWVFGLSGSSDVRAFRLAGVATTQKNLGESDAFYAMFPWLGDGRKCGTNARSYETTGRQELRLAATAVAWASASCLTLKPHSSPQMQDAPRLRVRLVFCLNHRCFHHCR